jgi:hypothetical protein
MSIAPHSTNMTELSQKMQISFILAILLTQSVSSIFYFIGHLIKRMFFPDKPDVPEEVI